MGSVERNVARAEQVVRGGKWFHFMTSTYGSWLYGDPRGFRTRHHREHVDGDYKNPPPLGLYSQQFERSIKSLKQPVVRLAKRGGRSSASRSATSWSNAGPL